MSETWITARIDPAKKAAFEARAIHEGITMTALLGRVIDQALRRWQNTAPAANHRDER